MQKINYSKLYEDFAELGWDYTCNRMSRSAMAYYDSCLLYTSPSPRDRTRSRMPSSA